MSEALTFDQKIQGLQDYRRDLTRIDPANGNTDLRTSLTPPDTIFYGRGFTVSRALEEARISVAFDIGCHGRSEYHDRGYAAMDLREDTAEIRAGRADVLAVMTEVLDDEQRQARAERIASVLSAITSGEPLRMLDYDRTLRRFSSIERVEADKSRPLFGVFRNSHISNRILTIQYGTPVTFAPTPDVEVGEPLVKIDIPALFKGNGQRFESLAA